MFSSGTLPLDGPGPRRPGRIAKRRPPAPKDAPRSTRKEARSAVPVLAASLESALVIGIVVVVLLFRHGAPPLSGVLPTSLAVAALSVGFAAFRQDYSIATLAAPRGQVERAMLAWSVGFGIAVIAGAATGAFSLEIRHATGLIFVGGLVAMPVARSAVSFRLRARAASGAITIRRVMIVVAERDVATVTSGGDAMGWGGRVVGTSILRDDAASHGEDLALAVAVARMLSPDDIVLVLPWDDHKLIADSVAALRQLPANIHLGPPAALCPDSGLGGFALIRKPLSPFDLRMKRVFDIVVAGSALVVLSPVLLLAALAIKLDSRGPVLFRQRRYGFNQQPFRIMKFRSMSVMEDSANLRQVTTGDVRVTRVGRFLRKSSIDELPQLLNVLKGDMSLIGPRPHALAHDQQFERMVALYGRRHNVRPGITGWAQVSGFRGEIDTPDKIEGRIRHDLAYIDNWSIWFDLSILFRTVFSRQTFRNAK